MNNDMLHVIEINQQVHVVFYIMIIDYQLLINLEMIYRSIQNKLHNDDLKKKKKSEIYIKYNQSS
jgi:hypothetical protein